MDNILAKIVVDKKRDLHCAEAPRRNIIMPRKSFREAIKGRGSVSLIAELKRSSPSAGTINKAFNTAHMAKLYESSGAAAISVVTDENFFGGDINMMSDAVCAVSLPVLRKDFIVDESQIVESKNAGASALLLIASILDEVTLGRFIALTRSLSMDPLVEIHNERELEIALRAGADIIGINNRDLKTFKVDIKTALRLASKIPDNVIIVSESGINDLVDIRMLDSKVDAVLVGTSILKSADPAAKIKQLKNSRPLLKICGVRDIDTAVFCEEKGVDIIGLNFFEGSARRINEEEAAKISAICRKIKKAGLFVNEEADEVNRIAEELKLDFVQLHGNETPEYCAKIQKPVIKAINVDQQSQKATSQFEGCVVFFVFDVSKSSPKSITDFGLPKTKTPFFAAGGITSENLRDVLHMSPAGVDIARGAETDGKKDFEKIWYFTRTLHAI